MCKPIVVLIMLAMIASCFKMQAATVTCEAGELSSCVEDLGMTELTVSGTIDVRDFEFINKELSDLVSINLANATIEGYECKDDESYFGKSGRFIDNELPCMCFFGKRYETVILPAGLKSIGECAMAGCSKLKSISIPEPVASIEEHAFNGSGLEVLDLSGNIETIGRGAFAGCRSLRVVNIEKTAECLIGDDAFARCVMLEHVRMGNRVVSIGNGAFKGCDSLKTLQVEDDSALVSIGDEAFMDTQLAGMPFVDCRRLENVGNWAFANASLENLSLPLVMNYVPEGVFFGNGDAGAMTIPDAATGIGKYAFLGCGDIKSFSIPCGMAHIDDNAFEGLSELTSIVSRAGNVPDLGMDVFYGINQPAVRLYVNDNLVNDYNLAEQWNLFEIVGLSGVSVANADDVHDVDAYFSGNMLEVEACAEIIRLTVADVSGIVVADVCPADCRASVAVSRQEPGIYVARIELSDGYVRTKKLIKR